VIGKFVICNLEPATGPSITNYKSPIANPIKFLSGECCSKKDLVIAMAGVARSEVRALSGAGIDDLVALETWQSDNEIVNLT
jgi:hypothetical protein